MTLNFKKEFLFIAILSLLIYGVYKCDIVRAALPEKLSEKDYSVGGIGINDTLDKVIEKYGQPTSQNEFVLGKLAYTQNDFNGRFSVYIMKGTNQIPSIEIKSNNIYTTRKVYIGSSNIEVESIYGNFEYKHNTEKIQ